jgi:hypothetical protein
VSAFTHGAARAAAVEIARRQTMLIGVTWDQAEVDEAADEIRANAPAWAGYFELLMVGPPEDRRLALEYLETGNPNTGRAETLGLDGVFPCALPEGW